MKHFLEGILLGLAYVAPIGMQNLFVINTALTQPKARVLQTVFIVAFFDITLALACFFGIGAIMDQFNILKMVILCIGSLIIMYMGFGLVRAKSDTMSDKDVNLPILKVIGTACVVTWFNPQAVIDGSLFLGAFRATLPPGESTEFIVGVCLASLLWFATVSTIISIFSNKFSPKITKGINVVCGAIMLFYGIKLFWSFIQML